MERCRRTWPRCGHRRSSAHGGRADEPPAGLAAAAGRRVDRPRRVAGRWRARRLGPSSRPTAPESWTAPGLGAAGPQHERARHETVEASPQEHEAGDPSETRIDRRGGYRFDDGRNALENGGLRCRCRRLPEATRTISPSLAWTARPRVGGHEVASPAASSRKWPTHASTQRRPARREPPEPAACLPLERRVVRRSSRGSSPPVRRR